VYPPLYSCRESLSGPDLRQAGKTGFPAGAGIVAFACFAALHTPSHAQSPSGGPSFDVARFDVSGATLIAPAAIDETLAPFRGAARTIADLEQARAAVEAMYARRGYGATQVLLPEQEIAGGVVRLRVIEARLGAVRIEGNRYFDDANVRASLPALVPGAPLATGRLATELQLANENPVKQTTVVLKPGGAESEVDAEVRVADARPWRFSLSLDNTGTPQTGNTRIGAGFQHANLFDRDHVLNLQYVTSPTQEDDPNQLALPPNSRVTIWGAGYHAPIPSLGDSIDLVAGYANVNSGVVQNLFNISGSGRVYAGRYNFGLPRLGGVEQKLSVGYDVSYFDNDVVPVGTSTTIVPDYVLHPLSLAYSGVWRDAADEVAVYASGVRNLPGGANGNQAQFDLVRPGAEADYALGRMNAVWVHRLPRDVQTRVRFTGQYTSDMLLPGAQFGIGGMDSVRGFFEREFVGDKGYSGTFELYSPDLAASGGAGPDVRLRFLAFYDYGRVWINDPQVFEQRVTGISSAGPGVRIGYRSNVSVRLDYGFVIQRGTASNTSSGRANFSLVWVF
jgi:hemolysin activation/secretion protein